MILCVFGQRETYDTNFPIVLLLYKLGQIKYKSHAFVVNEDITVEAVPKQQDVIRVFEIDVRSGKQMGVETAERKGRGQLLPVTFNRECTVVPRKQ